MIHNRAIGRTRVEHKQQEAQTKKYSLEEFLEKCDYEGAVTLLKFNIINKITTVEKPQEWLAYCYVHLGKYQEAFNIYERLLQSDDEYDADHLLHAAVCKVYMGEFEEARDLAQRGPANALQNRILFHIACKLQDDDALLQYHSKLQNVESDQLALAAVHYLRSHFEPSLETYKQLADDHPEYDALNLYMAMVHYRLDYYDKSLEVLKKYLAKYTNSLAAVNLAACNEYRLYTGAAAEASMKPYIAREPALGRMPLIRHNMVVFNDGKNADKILPELFESVPESRLNLVIYHLKRKESEEAWELIKDFEPSIPPEFILKASVAAMLGQDSDNLTLLNLAKEWYSLVGGSATEQDTVPGRQAMSACLFLLRQFDDVIIYLDSIKQYFENDPTFHWNYGMALAFAGRTEDALSVLQGVVDPMMREDPAYLLNMARLYIRSDNPDMAWELYCRASLPPEQSMELLQLIGNDCYTAKQWLHALKAFDALERLEPSTELWKAKRGAAVGLVRDVAEGKEDDAVLDDVVAMLKKSQAQDQAALLVSRIEQWRLTI
ncbi:Anaphase-promoting complex, cyclosome, subunit 3 [Carpediemonas membranifera]|uniref:Anaphase-promoting complex, cyclosome, subunit 3 n=1 Tax=Carpediemonas membranifera TaxID=201153 RepID=A0A8J6B6D2_9EUKA|nr:Anaphase-promoting complex, cyclosome, subunit 3 [Carpediemonas membranifera]|eukprot:KAG9394019.1 Anaphase-promoting complex, cyclosome, subunit 3 [Carpediemonas membranifera]